LLLTGCEEEPPPPVPVRSVKWLKVAEPSAEQQRRISGFIRAKESSELNFDVKGLVVSYQAELGDSVKKGQVLAQLDQEPFLLNVIEAEADLARAKARRMDAQANYQRTRLLYEADNASKADLDQSRANYEATLSQVKASQSKLGIIRRDLRKSTLRAPFDGTISARKLNVGERVGPLKDVYSLDGTAKGLQVQVDVPEGLISRIKRGQTVIVRFPANDQKTSARVSEVGTRAGSGNAFPVKADLVEDLSWARPGMTTEVIFTFVSQARGGQTDGFMIPIDAVAPGEGNVHYVFVFDPITSTVRKTQVESRGLRDNKADIIGGIKAGDIIVAAGVEFLADGQEVTLLEEQKH
jgi:RND family efflux transporter MFP subunit